jgi:hypothetical protein
MKTLKISDETYEAIKDQLGVDERIDISSIEDLVGKKLFIRTVTYHLTGRVTKVIGNMLQLEEAAYIADSGRFMQAIKDGELSEVEPVGDWFVNLGAVTDMGPWNHPLPTEQK